MFPTKISNDHQYVDETDISYVNYADEQESRNSSNCIDRWISELSDEEQISIRLSSRILLRRWLSKYLHHLANSIERRS